MKEVCADPWDAEFADKLGETRPLLYEVIMATNYMGTFFSVLSRLYTVVHRHPEYVAPIVRQGGLHGTAPSFFLFLFLFCRGRSRVTKYRTSRRRSAERRKARPLPLLAWRRSLLPVLLLLLLHPHHTPSPVSLRVFVHVHALVYFFSKKNKTKQIKTV
jgi:hypothetical protein